MLELSKRDAADIVKQLSALINLKINIVNSEAVIIANSDEKRVGDFHEASKQIIDHHLSELIAEDDTRFEGTRAGTNLPLVINDQIIGVVGITGEVSQARAYGQIIKKMCEILIQGKARDIQIEQRKKDREIFLIEWICDASTPISDSLKAKGLSFGIDIQKKRRVLVFSLDYSHENNEKLLINKILLSNTDNIAFPFKNTIVAAICPEKNEKILQFVTILHQECSFILGVGIDEEEQNTSFGQPIHLQFMQAKKALQALSLHPSWFYMLYENLYLELLLEDVSAKNKQLFLDKIFCSYADEEEIQHTLQILTVLYQENGSLKTSAALLHIHPNTLLYQIKKIAEKTGLDPRSFSSAAIFSLVLCFEEELQAGIR